MSDGILLANLTLSGHTGTEVVTRDLALGLARRGRRVTVFTRRLGPKADELQSAGVPVVTRLEDVDEPPAVIQGHHFLETLEALTAFPRAKGLFVCHDRTAAHSVPLRAPRVCRHVAVDENCRERLIEWGVPAESTLVIPNAVDMDRFPPRSPLPATPVRALVFSHYASESTHLGAIQMACRQLGIDVDVLGAASGSASPQPELLLGQYDLVFAKARCAIEALAVGSAVVLCDANGMGPMVTTENVRALRRWNLGARVLREPVTPERLVREIARYDPADAARVSALVRREASLEASLDAYTSLYATIAADAVPDATVSDCVAAFPPLLDRAAALEAALAAYQDSARMQPLSDDEIARIRLTFTGPSAVVEASRQVVYRVRIENAAPNPDLGSWPPFPLHLAYRWRREHDLGFAHVESPRTRLVPPTTTTRGVDYGVGVLTPVEPGRYVLRVTLVQDGVRWLDLAAVPVFAECPVVVNRSPGLRSA